jgi:GR25 family glycosyltransferase involved in LPS biosynthesis
MDLNPVIIHLENAVERMPFIEKMQELFGSIRIHNASDGSELMADPSFPKTHIAVKSVTTQGELGCYKSHLDVLEEFEGSTDDLRLVLEDDTVFFKDLSGLHSVIAEANTVGHWDILYFGYLTTHLKTKPVSPNLVKLNGCDGTHAMLLKRSAIQGLKAAFAKAKSSGRFYPADCVYSLAMKSGLVALGPNKRDAYCWIKTGLHSYVLGAIRKEFV